MKLHSHVDRKNNMGKTGGKKTKDAGRGRTRKGKVN